ncbi:MAG: PKD domain-containing protein [Bacteroidales bacterium]|nr:PKD domain-containing protein [Bacteroidales bacterium]
MIKKLILLFVALLGCASPGIAQHACDLVVLPEGNNLCISNKQAPNFSVVSACRGNTVSYRALSSSAISYRWAVAGGTFLLSDDSTTCHVTWGDDYSGMVSVEALLPDSTVCFSQIQVILKDKPIAGIISIPNYIVDVNNPDSIWIEACDGDTLSFVDNSTSSDQPIVDYFWHTPYGDYNSQSISFVARNPGKHTITHRVYNECGCYDEVVIQLIVNESCPLELSCFGTACAHSQHTYSIFNPDCSDYLWSVQNGTITSPQHSPVVTVLWDAPESGFGTLCLDGSSCDCSCKSRKSIKIPIISDNVSINGPDTLCLNNEYTFSLPLWGATLYSWSVTPSTGIYYSADNNNLTIIPQQHRAYTITATYSCSFLGCGPYTVTKEIVVKDPLSITPPSKEICVGANSSFSANTSSPSLWTIQLNDSTIHTVTAPALSYTFDTIGIFVIRASNRNYCSEAMATVNVKGNPPAPTAISGPDTICPGFTAEYSATPSSTDYHILWEWTIDGTTHTHVGNKANITFGQTVDDIKVYQVNRRTGCQSEATTYHVAPFRIADWPYDSLIRVCQGQTITLDKLRDQSGNDVLYEWKAYPAGALSVQGSHLNATVTLMANYSNNPPFTVMLVLKRVYCHTERNDTAYVRIGEIDPPDITHNSICAGEPATFAVSNPADADPAQTYWWTDNNARNLVYGSVARFTFYDTDQHTVHLHYVSKYGCDTDTSIAVTPCPSLPNMYFNINTTEDSLSVVLPGGDGNCTFLWMTGDTTPSIAATPDDYWCIVTDTTCGCTKKFAHTASSPGGCTYKKPAFGIVTTCYNIAYINNLCYGLTYPFDITLRQGDSNYHYKIVNASQRLMIPDTGAFSITARWSVGDSCFYYTIYDTIYQAIYVRLRNDCHNHLVVSGQRDDASPLDIYAIATERTTGFTPAPQTGTDSVSIPIADTGWYMVHIVFDNNPDCYIDTLFHFDAQPAIQNLYVRDHMCEHTAFIFLADATGEGLTYMWNFGDGYWNFGNGIDHVYDGARQSSVTLSVTDRNGCSITDSYLTFVVNNHLDNYPLWPFFNPICPGDSAVIATTNDNNNYIWHPCSRFDGHYLANVYEAGTYIVDITSIDEQCRKQVELNIAYPNRLFVDILCDSAYCQNEVAEFVGDIGPDYTYLWHITNSNGISGTATTPNFSYRLADPGTYQLVLQITDSNGCTASDTAHVLVHPTPPAPSLEFCGNPCITEGPAQLCSSSGQRLLWSNGTVGTEAFYFTDGPAGAYYIDTATGCRSQGATILIPEAPNFDGLLTGCYCIDRNAMPTELPLYTLGIHTPLPWDWLYNNNPIDNDMFPPSPKQLKIPSDGDYHLFISDYGNGCSTISPRLTIESGGCTAQTEPIFTPLVWAYVSKKGCTPDNCALLYQVTVTICNRTSDPVCIDNIAPILPTAASVTSGIPLVLNPGECQEATIDIHYDFSAPSSFVFFMTCSGEYVGSFVVNLSDWMDCAQPNTCSTSVTSTFVLDTMLSAPNQSAFFNFELSFPTISGNVLSVWCDQGQIIDGGFVGSKYAGLLMADYGLITQLVVDSTEFCFHILCCDDGKICMATACDPYSNLWQACLLLNEQEGHKAPTDIERTTAKERENAFRLEPNPATGAVRVVGRTNLPKDDISLIEVFTMHGQKVLSAESSDRFDISLLPQGSYIVKVVSVSDRQEYLKLIKK